MCVFVGVCACVEVNWVFYYGVERHSDSNTPQKCTVHKLKLSGGLFIVWSIEHT